MYSFKQLFYICTCISENTTTGSRLDLAEKFIADLKDEVLNLKESDSFIKETIKDENEITRKNMAGMLKDQLAKNTQYEKQIR